MFPLSFVENPASNYTSNTSTSILSQSSVCSAPRRLQVQFTINNPRHLRLSDPTLLLLRNQYSHNCSAPIIIGQDLSIVLPGKITCRIWVLRVPQCSQRCCVAAGECLCACNMISPQLFLTWWRHLCSPAILFYGKIKHGSNTTEAFRPNFSSNNT